MGDCECVLISPKSSRCGQYSTIFAWCPMMDDHHVSLVNLSVLGAPPPPDTCLQDLREEV